MYSAYVRYSIDVKLDLDATACCFKSRWGWDEGLVNANQYYQYKNIQATRVYMDKLSWNKYGLSENVQVCICASYIDSISKFHTICHSYKWRISKDNITMVRSIQEKKILWVN